MTTRGHRHAVHVCACGAVQSQCRCVDDHKERWVICQTCDVCRARKQVVPGMATFVWDDWTPPVLRREDMPPFLTMRELMIAADGPPRDPFAWQIVNWRSVDEHEKDESL